VQRRFRLFIRSGTYGKMRPWLTLANHTSTIPRMEQLPGGRSDKDASDNPIDPRAFGLAKAAYGVGETLDMFSIGRTSLYAAAKRGDLKRVKFGKKTLFYAADLASFLTKLDAAECALISNLATNQEKRELFARLAEHLMVLASEVERAIAKGDGR
jgi:hypothetical protein